MNKLKRKVVRFKSRTKKEEKCQVATECVLPEGQGYVAASLIKKLLQNGHIVHTTLRNLDDESKVGILNSLPNATTNLVLFEADIYKPHQFEAAITGTHFVFHVATPLRLTHGSQFGSTTEASVTATKMIAKFCVESGTVRRLIYTASIVSMSPMKDDHGRGLKELLMKAVGRLLIFPILFLTHIYWESEESERLEVVSLVCGVIAGECLLILLQL
ncbi:hypothetical protein IC582_012193 [Cucumis melo]